MLLDVFRLILLTIESNILYKTGTRILICYSAFIQLMVVFLSGEFLFGILLLLCSYWETCVGTA
jgi:hypothetical protein